MKVREHIGTGLCSGCRTTQTIYKDPRGHAPVCAACMDASDLRRTHELKCWPPYFEELSLGRKTFELRKDDRQYRVGDILRLREWAPTESAPIDPKSGSYTRREHKVRVTYKLLASAFAFGLQPGYAILSVVPVFVPDDDGAACYRLGCPGVVPEGKVGCEAHRLEGDEG